MPTALNTIDSDADEITSRNSVDGHKYTSESYEDFIPAVRTPISSASGGTQLQNIPCGKVLIRNGSGNGVMFLGGVGQNAPFSGRGYSIYANEAMTIPIKNSNRLSLLAQYSGQYVEYAAMLIGNNVDIDVSGIYIQPDTVPPTIIGTAPVDQASGIATNAEISVDFSEDMLSGTINTTAFTVRASGSSTNISGVAFLNTSNTQEAIFIPYSGLILTSTIYVGRMATSVTDLGNNALQTSGMWVWTTEASPPPPDSTPPNVSGTTPVSGAIGVDTLTNVVASISEQVQSGTVSTTTAFITISGNQISGVVTLGADLKTATINPAITLNNSSKYFIQITSGIQDLAGNFLSPNVTGRPFTTQAFTATITPGSGTVANSVSISPTVTFGNSVQSGTITSNTLAVYISGTPVTSAVSLAADLKTVTINPNNDLLFSKIYYVVITSGVVDVNGNNFSAFSGNPFTTRDPTFNVLYTVSPTGSIHNIDDGRWRISQRVDNASSVLYSGLVQKVEVELEANSALNSGASGFIAQIRKADGTIPGVFGVKNPATIATDPTTYGFTNTDISYRLNSGDKIEFQWLSGDSSNAIRIGRTTTSAYANTHLQLYEDTTYSGASYNDQSSEDMAGATFYASV